MVYRHVPAEFVWTLKRLQFVTAFFDEVLNDAIKEIQMSVSIRLRDVRSHQAFTRYFSSAFLGHSTVEGLKSNFEKPVATFLLPKLLQIPSKGPCVNPKFLNQFFKHHDDQSLLTLVHVVFTLHMVLFRLEIELLFGN